jgi:hypothetical protein
MERGMIPGAVNRVRYFADSGRDDAIKDDQPALK